MSYKIKNLNGRCVSFIAGTFVTAIIAMLLGNSLLSASEAQVFSDANSTLNQQSTLSASGSATTNVVPDKVTIILGVESNEKTAQDAITKNADMINKVLEALKELGIAENQTGTSNYNLSPIYQDNNTAPKSIPCIEIFPQPPECQQSSTIVGYKASNSLSVTLNVQGNVDAGKVVDAATAAGANNVDNVFFFISSQKQQVIRDSLMGQAIANAKHRAELAAGALNMTVYGIQSIDLNDVQFPVAFSSFKESSAASNSQTQLLPGEQEISASVSIVFYIASINSTTSQNTASLSTGQSPPL